MADVGKQGSGRWDAGTPGASEPITLTDPDGSVTRVAPWSTWTREQVRAPGGEPALVTRLDQGQLWFAAGRRRSPWRHEVHVGPAIVSTPQGRFHVTAEADGGATVACLAGRARVVAGLREPVVLEPDQTASVSSDGGTLVVVDRRTEAALGEDGAEGADPIALPDAWPSDELADLELTDEGETPVAEPDLDGEPVGDEAVASGESEVRPETDDGHGEPAVAPAVAGGDGDHFEDDHEDDDDGGAHRRGWSRIPEVIAIVALLGVLAAAVIVFGGSSDDADLVAGTPTTADQVSGPTSTTAETATTRAPTTVAPTTAAPTTAAPTTVAPTTSPPALVAPGTAEGVLVSCKRAPGGVLATVTVAHASGGPGRFVAKVGLVDGAGQVFATGEGRTDTLAPEASVAVEVLVTAAGEVRGACELLGVVTA